MRLLLFLEHRFYKIDNEVYCERIVNYQYLKRYLSAFDEVTVCARFGENAPIKRVLASGKGISFLPLPDFIGSSGIAKQFFKCQRIIKENLSAYDAVIIRSPSPISVIVYPIVKCSRIPFSVEIVINPKTMFCKDSYPSKIRPIISAFFTNHTKKLCLNANGVSYVTEHVLQELYPCRAMKNPSKKYFTEYYSSIDLRKNQCCEKIHEHMPGSAFVIAHTGYMDSYSKGHVMVMNVAKQLIDKGVPVEVHFIGTGTMENEFKSYAHSLGISSSIIFCGSLNGYAEVQKELANADLFLLPTCSEGLPRSLIEAMANSIACISSPVDGIVELLSEDCLVSYKDQDAVFNACYKLLVDDEKRKKIAKKCYEKAQEYTSDILDERRKKFYNTLSVLASKK